MLIGASRPESSGRSPPLGEGSEHQSQSEELGQDVVLVEGQDRDADAGEHEKSQPDGDRRLDGFNAGSAVPGARVRG